MKTLFGNMSKKLVAFLVYVAVVLLNRKLNIGLGENEILALTGATGAYTLGQGIADFGKGKALLENGVMKKKTK